MPMRFIQRHSLDGTARHVRSSAYETRRFLLAEDGLDVTVTDILLQPGVPVDYGYDHHVEIAYCIDGDATIREHGTDQEQRVGPGTMWIAERGDRFSFVAHAPTRLICVFTPPFAGHETGFAGDQ